MRKVTPYRSFHGAARALDNGGRFYNVFTKAGDAEVTSAELSKAAGLGGGLGGAFLFFELATAELSDGDRSQLRAMLAPSLKEKWDKKGPAWLEPEAFDEQAELEKSFIVEGVAEKHDEETAVTCFIMIPVMVGQVTTFTQIPITEAFDVYFVGSRDGVGEGGCVVVVPKGAKVPQGVSIRWGGIAKERREGKGDDAPKRLYLEPRYYTVLG